MNQGTLWVSRVLCWFFASSVTEINIGDLAKDGIWLQEVVVSPSHKQASAKGGARDATGMSAARVHRLSNHHSILNMAQIQRLSDLTSLFSRVRFSGENISVQRGPGDYPSSMRAHIATKGQTLDLGRYVLRSKSSCAPEVFSKRHLIDAGSIQYSTSEFSEALQEGGSLRNNSSLICKD